MKARLSKSLSTVMVMIFIFAMSMMQVLAATIPYTITTTSQVHVTQIDNKDTSNACLVRLNTRPNTPNSTVTIHVKAALNAEEDLYVKSFPSAVSVSDLAFSMPAGTTYYIYVSAGSQFPVQGSVSITQIYA